MREPCVNITLITFNRWLFTQRCIKALSETADFPRHVTVVDNGSTDETKDGLKQFLASGAIHRIILNGKNAGVAAAANQGWRALDTDYYLKLDNDIVFQRKGWLSGMVEACDKIPDAGSVGYNFETRSFPLTVLNGIPVRPKQGNLGGCCVMIPRRVHEKIGFWCEDYYPYGTADTDMGWRIIYLGLKNYYLQDENVGIHLPEGKASPLDSKSFTAEYDEGDPQYRQFKDDYRKIYAGKNRLFEINRFLYRKKLRPVYCDSGAEFLPSRYVKFRLWLRFGVADPWHDTRFSVAKPDWAGGPVPQTITDIQTTIAR